MYAIWYTDNDNVVHKTAWGSDDWNTAVDTVNSVRAVVREGVRRYKRVWIAWENHPGVMGTFYETEEPQYEKRPDVTT